MQKISTLASGFPVKTLERWVGVGPEGGMARDTDTTI